MHAPPSPSLVSTDARFGAQDRPSRISSKAHVRSRTCIRIHTHLLTMKKGTRGCKRSFSPISDTPSECEDSEVMEERAALALSAVMGRLELSPPRPFRFRAQGPGGVRPVAPAAVFSPAGSIADEPQAEAPEESETAFEAMQPDNANGVVQTMIRHVHDVRIAFAELVHVGNLNEEAHNAVIPLGQEDVEEPQNANRD